MMSVINLWRILSEILWSSKADDVLLHVWWLLQIGETDKEQETHIKQLASTLRCVLSVYESLCSLKQVSGIHLQVYVTKSTW